MIVSQESSTFLHPSYRGLFSLASIIPHVKSLLLLVFKVISERSSEKRKILKFNVYKI